MGLFFHAAADDENKGKEQNLSRIVFEERQIEGKMRSAPLILITVDKRPQFTSIIIENHEGGTAIEHILSSPVFTESPYASPVVFNHFSIRKSLH